MQILSSPIHVTIMEPVAVPGQLAVIGLQCGYSVSVLPLCPCLQMSATKELAAKLGVLRTRRLAESSGARASLQVRDFSQELDPADNVTVTSCNGDFL